MGKRVLIVEDGFGDRMILRDYIMSAGYSIVGEAKSGRESIEKYKALKPDLVVLDAAMPDMDGITIVRALLREDEDANIVLCVAKGQRVLAMEALSAGAKDMITKPIDFRRLRRVLSQAA